MAIQGRPAKNGRRLLQPARCSEAPEGGSPERAGARNLDFLRPPQPCIRAPRIPGFWRVGFPWNSLDSLVRNRAFSMGYERPQPVFLFSTALSHSRARFSDKKRSKPLAPSDPGMKRAYRFFRFSARKSRPLFSRTFRGTDEWQTAGVTARRLGLGKGRLDFSGGSGRRHESGINGRPIIRIIAGHHRCGKTDPEIEPSRKFPLIGG